MAKDKKKHNKSASNKSGAGKNTGKDRSQANTGRTESTPQADTMPKDSKPSWTNDVDWYAVSKSILDDSGSLPFSNPIGSDITLPSATPGGVGVSASGIAVIELQPTLPYSKEANSALNTAAAKFYAFIRQANSGSKNYEAPDLTMYMLACGELFALMSEARRAYGLMRDFSNYNKYLGRNLLNALDWDYDDLLANQAEFRRRFNVLVSQINGTLHVPKDFPYYSRKAFIPSAVYVDHPGHKFQMYAFQFKEYWRYDATTFATGTSLQSYAMPSPKRVGTFFATIEQCVADLLAEEDIHIMSGDLLKAYGDSGCMQLAELDFDYRTPIVFDVPVLAQIHNIQSNVGYIGGSYDGGSGLITEGICWAYPMTIVTPGNIAVKVVGNSVVYQNNGILCCEPVYLNATGTRKLGVNNLLLDIPVEQPTPGDVMESTRLMQFVSENTGYTATLEGTVSPPDVVWLSALWCMTEIVSAVKVTGLISGAVQNFVFLNTAPVHEITTINSGNVWTEIGKYFSAMSGYDWAPVVNVIARRTAANGGGARVGFGGDVSQFTLITEQVIANLHNSAIYGLLNVPTYSVSR